ncbi:MAG: GNAT family N-acetyltransferase [Chlamydiia bacterium]|nr:GNAT family N-acetyltransferase [Chlamydiia bacterium]
MHKNEFKIDESLVQKLLADQFPQWGSLPLARVISSGTDNALFRLGEDKVVRLPRIDWAVGNIAIECEWLPKIAPKLPCAVPQPLALGTPTNAYPYPWAVYGWLEGNSPEVGFVSKALLDDLISFIRALHRIDLPEGPACPRGVSLKKVDEKTRGAIWELEGMIDTKAVLALWERALEAPEWSGPPSWMHGDLSAGNLLTREGRLSAVIDFGNLGVGDPACDLNLAWNLLPASLRGAFRAGMGYDEATWERARGRALSNALIALPYYKETNPFLANNSRHVIDELIRDYEMYFAPVKASQLTLLHSWFQKPHIKEWMHGEGLQNTLKGLEKLPEDTYWICYERETPFAFLITSPEGDDAITLDLFIGDTNYLGRGLAVPMIHKFLLDLFPNKKRVFIDPEATNKRAIHVYEKAGFKFLHEFIAPWHPVPHHQMVLETCLLVSE